MRSIRRIALAMVADRPGHHRITLGPDKAYDEAGFVAELHEYNVTPHVAQNTTNRRSAIDGRTTRHSGYAVSGQVRKRIEEVFGWTKAAAGLIATWNSQDAERIVDWPPNSWLKKSPVATQHSQYLCSLH